MSDKQPEISFVGQSEAVRAIQSDIDCAARSDAKVLITGETGVGKEIVAKLIHFRSARSAAALVTLNCAGLPDSLLESELFGHVRGSFTGAYRDKPGLLEMAPNGTVFLDEVGEMSMRMQAVLLRFLESGEIQRIGADRPHTRVNVRLITATNRDLQTHIETGAFREDLYFRLNVIRLCVPPLREREGDVSILIRHFLDSYSRTHKVAAPEIMADAMETLTAYRWPGNIRELKNVVERIVLKHAGEQIRHRDLPGDLIRKFGPAPLPGSREGAGAAQRASPADEMISLMQRGESFWAVVYPMFMARDMTRADLRRIVQSGLENTNGNYRLMVRLFNMPEDDYKRFLSFLRKHDCHLPFQRFRAVPARLQSSQPLRALAKA